MSEAQREETEHWEKQKPWKPQVRRGKLKGNKPMSEGEAPPGT